MSLSRTGKCPSSVHDDAHAEAPADVDEDHVGVGLLAEGHIFAVGHRAGVVLDRDRDVEFLLENALEGEVVADEIRQAVALLRIDAARKAHAHAQDLDPGDAALDDLVHDHAAHRAEGVLVGLQHEFDVLDVRDDLAFEIADRDVEVVTRHVHADKVARVRIESVHARAASAGGAYLAFVLDEILIDQLADEFGDRGHADAQRPAEVGDAVVVVSDAQPQDFPLDVGALAGDVVKEGVGHNRF